MVVSTDVCVHVTARACVCMTGNGQGWRRIIVLCHRIDYIEYPRQEEVCQML